MNWMTDPQNGDYTLTAEANSDLRYQQLYYHLLPYKAGIANANNPDYLIYESVAAHAAVNKPQVYVDKYFRGAPGDGCFTKFPLIRLADIYITRAWLNWKAGNSASAITDLNKVWNRANPGNLNKYNTGNVSHDAILGEYIKEMSGEGWTLDFFMATKTDIPAGDVSGRLPVAAPYSSWHWVIPATERSLNPNYK